MKIVMSALLAVCLLAIANGAPEAATKQSTLRAADEAGTPAAHQTASKEPPSMADFWTSNNATEYEGSTMFNLRKSDLKVLEYQNAKCTLGKDSKLLWYPHSTWWHVFFGQSVTRDHNPFYQIHDFLQGRVNTVPCQVTDVKVNSLVAPVKSASEKPPAVTWLAATYTAGPLGFWAYDSAGNSMCRFCFFQFGWDVTERSCQQMIEAHAGKGEFDCSYEVDHNLAESNLAYIGHDIPSFWSSDYMKSRAIMWLCFVCLLMCCSVCAGPK